MKTKSLNSHQPENLLALTINFWPTTTHVHGFLTGKDPGKVPEIGFTRGHPKDALLFILFVFCFTPARERFTSMETSPLPVQSRKILVSKV